MKVPTRYLLRYPGACNKRANFVSARDSLSRADTWSVGNLVGHAAAGRPSEPPVRGRAEDRRKDSALTTVLVLYPVLRMTH